MWGVLLAGLALGACGGDPVPPKVRGVVLIVVDTLRADHLGSYDYPRPTTPELDSWSKRGALFEQAIAPSPWTLPSFASILTGRYPAGHGAGTERRIPPGGGQARFSALAPDVQTLPEILQGQGYATGALVTNTFLDPHFGLDRGFETYDQARNRFIAQRRIDHMAAKALTWLDQHRERPFFLMVQLLDPHLPYAPPEEVSGLFTAGYGGRLELPLKFRFGRVNKIRSGEWKLSGEDQAFIRGAYDEEIRFVDLTLGRFLQRLDQEGLLEEALAILTADHGEELFDHQSFEHGHTLYQELLRVPLMFWGPGIQGTRLSTPVSLVDLAPTILDALGMEVPEGIDGRSLWPALLGRRRILPRSLRAEATLYGPQRQAILAWPYKAIVDSETGKTQLFDLATDPGEVRDLSASSPRRLAELLGELEHARSLTVEGQGRGLELDERLREELRSLGYVE